MTLLLLGDICKPKQWRALPTSQLLPNGYPVYGANGVIGYTDQYTHVNPVLAIGCRGTIGSVHITEHQSFITNNAMALDDLDVDRVCLRFLAHFLKWRGFADVTSGSSQPQLTRQNLIRIAVPAPPMPQQFHIAEILDQADALRTKRRQVLQEFDKLKSALFHHLFSGTDWPREEIRRVGWVVTGKTPPTSTEGMFGGSIPFMTPGDLASEHPPARTVTSAGAKASRSARQGSTLVCCIGATIGKVGMAPSRIAFNQQINAIEWGARINDQFGLQVMKNLRPYIVSQGSSTTLPLLPKGRFEKIVIPVPPAEIQNLFAQRASLIDNHRKKLAQDAVHLDQLFKSLQSRAFRGEL